MSEPVKKWQEWHLGTVDHVYRYDGRYLKPQHVLIELNAYQTRVDHLETELAEKDAAFRGALDMIDAKDQEIASLKAEYETLKNFRLTDTMTSPS